MIPSHPKGSVPGGAVSPSGSPNHMPILITVQQLGSRSPQLYIPHHQDVRGTVGLAEVTLDPLFAHMKCAITKIYHPRP